MLPVDRDALARYRDAGVDQVILVILALDRDGLLTALDGLAESITLPASKL